MLHNKTIDDLIDIQQIYIEPDVVNYKRGQEILAKYPNAKRIEVALTLENSRTAWLPGLCR